MRRIARSLSCMVIAHMPSLVFAQFFVDASRPDPSVRHLGMAGATTGTFWTSGEGAWGNPAALGSVRNLEFQWSTAELPRDQYGRRRFRAERLRAGAFGAGIELGGVPSGIGFTRQKHEAVQFDGEIFRIREEMESWTVGTNVLELADNILRSASPAVRTNRQWNEVRSRVRVLPPMLTAPKIRWRCTASDTESRRKSWSDFPLQRASFSEACIVVGW